jgi:NADH:ubiquinone oxidoreductase subunit 3 (subunit A)
MDYLCKAFSYLAVFCYTIKEGKSKSDLDSMLTVKDPKISIDFVSIVMTLPQYIRLDTMPAKDLDFYTGVKQTFERIFETEYDGFVTSRQEMLAIQKDITPVLGRACLSLAPLVNYLYTRVISTIEGTVWFPLNRDYMVKRIFDTLQNDNVGKKMSSDYNEKISNTIYDSVIAHVGTTFDALSVKKKTIIEDVSMSLLPYKLNVITYQNYIVSQLVKQNPDSKPHVEEIKDIVKRIHKTSTNKRQAVVTSLVKDDKKFKDVDEFVTLIDDISFNELEDNLNVDYYAELVTGFYTTISENVQLEKSNLNNLFFERKKGLALWRIVVVMMIVLLVLLLVRFIMGLLDSKERIPKMKATRECDEKYTEQDFMNRNTNWYIQLVLSSIIAFFMISILISFYRKIKASFEFNIDIIESNTNQLKSLLGDFQRKFVEISESMNDMDREKKIGVNDNISKDDKQQLYDYVTRIIDRYEKSNFIIESAKSTVPFPYTEVTMYGIILVTCIVCVFVVFFTFAPLKHLADIKYMNKLKQELLFTKDLASFSDQLQSFSTCHNEEIDGLVLTMKLIFFGFLIVFLMYYSVTIISTSSDFKMGLYNSNYFDEGRSYNG